MKSKFIIIVSLYLLVSILLQANLAYADGKDGAIDKNMSKLENKYDEENKQIKDTILNKLGQPAKNSTNPFDIRQGTSDPVVDDVVNALSQSGHSIWALTFTILTIGRKNSFPICILIFICGLIYARMLGASDLAKRRKGYYFMYSAIGLFVALQVIPVLIILYAL